MSDHDNGNHFGHCNPNNPHYNEDCPSIPEPSTFGLLMVGMMLALFARRMSGWQKN